jgi:hypothetical protein
VRLDGTPKACPTFIGPSVARSEPPSDAPSPFPTIVLLHSPSVMHFSSEDYTPLTVEGSVQARHPRVLLMVC